MIMKTLREYINLIESAEQSVSETSGVRLTLNHAKGKFASVVWYNQYDDPIIDYHATLEDAIEDGSETSAWRNQAYAWNGKKWIRKYSATEPSGGYSGGHYGSW